MADPRVEAAARAIFDEIHTPSDQAWEDAMQPHRDHYLFLAKFAVLAADRVDPHRERLTEALEQIAAMRGRFHPIAGYQFDTDPRKIARSVLTEGKEPTNGEPADNRGA